MTISSVAFANGDLGRRVVRAMASSGGLRAVFVHPAEKAVHRDEIEDAAKKARAEILVASGRSNERVEQLRRLGGFDVGVSAGYGYIMREEEFSYPRFGTVNLHISLLPLNRGAHPNAWAIADGTPAGVTLHFVDAGVDTGDILEQRECPYFFSDTAQTLYRRLIEEAESLFLSFWPKSESYWQRPPRVAQAGRATEHRVRDLELLRLPPIDSSVNVGKLLQTLRARSFPPHPGAAVDIDGKRYRIRLEIEEDG